jgi:hypothetical protein
MVRLTRTLRCAANISRLLSTFHGQLLVHRWPADEPHKKIFTSTGRSLPIKSELADPILNFVSI